MATAVGKTAAANDRIDDSSAHEVARDLSRLVFAVAHGSQQHFEDAAASFGLAAPQARALLGLDGPAPMRALAASMGCDASNITGIADRLEKRGLVERQPDEHDRRVKLLVLTPAGAQLRDELADRITHGSRIMTELSDDERATLQALLLRVAGPDLGGVCG